MNRETADRETDRLTGSSIPFEGPFSLSGDAHLQGQKYKAAVTTGTTDTINSQMEEGVAITLQRKKSPSVLSPALSKASTLYCWWPPVQYLLKEVASHHANSFGISVHPVTDGRRS